MPLSEHEQRQLEQIEQALRGGDPQLADALQAADPVRYRRWVTAAALGFLAGVGLLFAGVVIKIILIAVAGFLVMLACSLWAVTSYQRMAGITTARGPAQARVSAKRRAAKARRPGNQGRSGQMRWLEERWRRRQERGR